jgi:hypothetical protein
MLTHPYGEGVSGDVQEMPAASITWGCTGGAIELCPRGAGIVSAWPITIHAL